MVYLMLDFDGVLHPEGCMAGERFCHLQALQSLLRQWPDVKIVISSMWRLDATLPSLRSHFARDIAERIVGLTPDLFDPAAPDSRGLRQRECEAWIAANDPGAAWIALDDRREFFDADCRHLVAVPFYLEGGVGVQPEHLAELARRIRRLQRQAGA